MVIWLKLLAVAHGSLFSNLISAALAWAGLGAPVHVEAFAKFAVLGGNGKSTATRVDQLSHARN